MNEQTPSERAALLIAQVMKTWNPPRYGMGSPEDVAQTSIMQALAFVFGPSALPISGMNLNQQRAIVEGLEFMTKVLTPSPEKPAP